MANIIEKYEGFPITFENKDGKMMVNATQMGKAFGKKPSDWLKTQSAQEFISSLSKVKKITLADLQQVVRGGDANGTWFHEDVAIAYARWLSGRSRRIGSGRNKLIE